MDKCETCKGTGTVPAHYHWRGVVGDGEGTCPDCGGTGKEA